ncbi:MAG: prenyltransferase [Coprobacillus sp.]
MEKNKYDQDIEVILSHQYDQGADLWTTPDKRLLKGGPFSTLESVSYLIELGMPKENIIMKQVADLIFDAWREDGRVKLYPTGGIYPCQTAIAIETLCKMGYVNDERVRKSLTYFLDTQETDGGWKCNKYSFGRGEETNYSTPNTTLTILDIFRYTDYLNNESSLDKAVEFLLQHWVIRKPISPCHYGIGTLFMQCEYPFRGYNLFYYVYILSFYDYAKKDKRFLEAFKVLEGKTINNQMVVERVVPKLAKLSFCKKGEVSELATKRWDEILINIHS